jgi:hypothetical protein
MLINWSYIPPPHPIMLTIKPIMVDTFWARHPISLKAHTFWMSILINTSNHISLKCVCLDYCCARFKHVYIKSMHSWSFQVLFFFWICQMRTRGHHVDSLLDQFIHEFTCLRSCNNDLSCLSSPHTQGTQWGPIKSTDRISDYFVCFLSS